MSKQLKVGDRVTVSTDSLKRAGLDNTPGKVINTRSIFGRDEVLVLRDIGGAVWYEVGSCTLIKEGVK